MYWCDILTSHSETRSDLAPYLFINAVFVFNPFNESLLNLSEKRNFKTTRNCEKRSFSHFNAWGSLPRRNAPGISSWVGTRAAIRDNQNNSAQLGNSARSARMVRHICIQCIASIEIIVLEYVMETPTLAYDVASYGPHLCPVLGKTGMEWEPFIKIKTQ